MQNDQDLRRQLARARAELNALKWFLNDSGGHEGGCQSPHGGKCRCGWNLIEAELDDFDGESKRAAWLRQGCELTDDEDRARVAEIIVQLKTDLAGGVIEK